MASIKPKLTIEQIEKIFSDRGKTVRPSYRFPGHVWVVSWWDDGTHDMFYTFEELEKAAKKLLKG